jgi:archaellum component FlaG (FlaF/FlaG flagellin family)
MFKTLIYGWDATTNTEVALSVDANGNLKTNNNKGFNVQSLSVVTQNVIPTLAFAPDSQSTIAVFVDGSIQTVVTNYTVSGTTITWVGPGNLLVGSIVDAIYMYTVTS